MFGCYGNVADGTKLCQDLGYNFERKYVFVRDWGKILPLGENFIAVNTFLFYRFSVFAYDLLTFLFQTFKKNIENPDQYNGPILTPLQVKSIFGKIPPIYDVHCQIRDELEEIVNNWREDIIIGNVILKHVSLDYYDYCLSHSFFSRYS